MKLCKIYAPNDGMVIYAKDNGSEIAEGVTVRQRQTLITLPDLSRMQVRTQIHEAALDQVQTGQSVTVKIGRLSTSYVRRRGGQSCRRPNFFLVLQCQNL